MKFSIITPCFNSEKTIQRTINSMLNQTFKDYEYIIVDGESNDRTLDIINSYKDKFQGKLIIISEPDKGIYDAMNKGIKLAKGDIIGIVNSDDFYENICLETINEKYNNESLQIIYGMMRIIDKNGDELGISFNHHRNMKIKMINHPASFVTKKLYDKYGLYDLSFKSASDFDFMLKMSKFNDVQFVPVYKLITNFTIGGISSNYIGIQEDNKVRYKYGLISKKKYMLTKSKNVLKHYLNI